MKLDVIGIIVGRCFFSNAKSVVANPGFCNFGSVMSNAKSVESVAKSVAKSIANPGLCNFGSVISIGGNYSTLIFSP